MVSLGYILVASIGMSTFLTASSTRSLNALAILTSGAWANSEDSFFKLDSGRLPCSFFFAAASCRSATALRAAKGSASYIQLW